MRAGSYPADINCFLAFYKNYILVLFLINNLNKHQCTNGVHSFLHMINSFKFSQLHIITTTQTVYSFSLSKPRDLKGKDNDR